MSPKSTPNKVRASAALSAFIAFHILVIFIWSVPSEIRPVAVFRKIVRPYVLWVGLNQSWDMFAPNPKSVDQYMKAVVITDAPKMRVYAFPRMEDLTVWQKYRQERYRKFTESILPDKYSGLWPDVAKRVAYIYANPNDPPDKVMLVKFESAIDPQKTKTADDANAKPTLFFEQYIQPGDLQ
jgi:hypothetical protein